MMPVASIPVLQRQAAMSWQLFCVWAAHGNDASARVAEQRWHEACEQMLEQVATIQIVVKRGE
jgi:hypothetical protein